MPHSSASDSGVLKGGPTSSEVTTLAEVHVCLLPSRKDEQESGVSSPLGSMTQRMLLSYLFTICSLALVLGPHSLREMLGEVVLAWSHLSSTLRSSVGAEEAGIDFVSELVSSLDGCIFTSESVSSIDGCLTCLLLCDKRS